jgi:molybdenum cofactor biosynthesis enzyme
LVAEAGLKKGDVVAVAELAGIMAAKATARLIPLCHPLAITNIQIKIAPHEQGPHFLTGLQINLYCMFHKNFIFRNALDGRMQGLLLWKNR